MSPLPGMAKKEVRSIEQNHDRANRKIPLDVGFSLHFFYNY
jgi:hypothetical protein